MTILYFVVLEAIVLLTHIQLSRHHLYTDCLLLGTTMECFPLDSDGSFESKQQLGL